MPQRTLSAGDTVELSYNIPGGITARQTIETTIDTVDADELGRIRVENPIDGYQFDHFLVDTDKELVYSDDDTRGPCLWGYDTEITASE